ncbi:MAG TPA: glycosyltransferase [Acidimicrobiia bacterium]|nr:glycosyltransferase [Acidimicrobiia bacterium]
MRASIVVPAHNEATVIGRTLRRLLQGAEPGELEVVVVANGCTDDTAAVARGAGSDVRVVETETASKIAALNLGDANAEGFPRIYLDADIAIDIDTVRKLVAALDEPHALAASPTMRMDTIGRPWSVRAYYRVWMQLPYVTDSHLAGVIALSRAGRSRFGAFPEVVGDDVFVRGQFAPDERRRLDSCSYVVQAPWSLRSLLRVKVRSFMGTIELSRRYPDVASRARGRGGVRGRLRVLARQPAMWPDLACYVGVWACARGVAVWKLRAGKQPTWYRDETTRAGSPT